MNNTADYFSTIYLLSYYITLLAVKMSYFFNTSLQHIFKTVEQV